ncbi:hypothetical protein KP509_05G001900 [Ceratopteris richardii]|uniref:Uncharacterized protein n=1 Tax=Ceratopteris richardii TaxID=49495 RepID=A0A8T2UIV5_CERRI|nr:hypothetical protein KP509_05G001900 [Ceratopteris richardii]
MPQLKDAIPKQIRFTSHSSSFTGRYSGSCVFYLYMQVDQSATLSSLSVDGGVSPIAVSFFALDHDVQLSLCPSVAVLIPLPCCCFVGIYLVLIFEVVDLCLSAASISTFSYSLEMIAQKDQILLLIY